MLMAFYNCRITHTLLDSTFITDEISDICSTTFSRGIQLLYQIGLAFQDTGAHVSNLSTPINDFPFLLLFVDSLIKNHVICTCVCTTQYYAVLRWFDLSSMVRK